MRTNAVTLALIDTKNMDGATDCSTNDTALLPESEIKPCIVQCTCLNAI